MAKVRTQQIGKNERYEMIGDFYDIVTNLKTKKEVIGFFMGLLTPSEALMFARRIQIAALLLDGKGYDEIKKEMNVGISTISTVNKWLYGENEQFKKKIYEHKKRKDSLKKEKGGKKKYYGNLLDKYPQHRILKDLFGLRD